MRETIITLKADTIDYIVLNDGVTELQSAIQDIVFEDKLTEGIITAVGDTKYQPIGDYVTNTELNDKGYITAIPNEYITDDELDSKGYLTSIPEEYVTETELIRKGYLTEHQPIKTINGESIVGTGNITIEGGGESADLSNYYTKGEIDDMHLTTEVEIAQNRTDLDWLIAEINNNLKAI